MKGNNSEERFLLNRLIHGDKEALRYFFSRYYNDLCNLANFYLHSAQSSEEIAQEVFVTLWEKKKDLQIEYSIHSYLIKAVKNKCLNFTRDRQNKIRILEKINSRQEIHYQAPEDHMDENLLRETINDSVQSLPPKCREIFIMAREKNMSHKQIAEKLNISPKTVENQIGKALKIIKSDLNPYIQDFLD